MKTNISLTLPNALTDGGICTDTHTVAPLDFQQGDISHVSTRKNSN
jgi:hypothetical protein